MTDKANTDFFIDEVFLAAVLLIQLSSQLTLSF